MSCARLSETSTRNAAPLSARAFGQAALLVLFLGAPSGCDAKNDGAVGRGASSANGAASTNGATSARAATPQPKPGASGAPSADAAPAALAAWNDPVRLGPPSKPLEGARARLPTDSLYAPKRDRAEIVRPAGLKPVLTFGSMAPGSIADDDSAPTVMLLAKVRDSKTWYRTVLRPLTSAELAGVASTESVYVNHVTWTEKKDAVLGAAKLPALVWYGEGEGRRKVRVRLCKVVAKLDDATELFATASWIVGDAAKEDLALALLANMVPIAP